MSALDRSFWLAIGVVAYVGTAGMHRSGVSGGRVLALVLVVLVLARVWSQSRAQTIRAYGGAGAPGALRLAATGAACWVAARTGPPQVDLLELAALGGLAAATLATLFTLARVPFEPGLLRPIDSVLPAPAQSGQGRQVPRILSGTRVEAGSRARPHRTLSLDATWFAGTLWLAAWLVVAARFSRVGPAQLDPLSLDYVVVAASIGSLLLLLASTWRLSALRRLELGTGDRASGALALIATSLCVALPTAAADLAPPDRVLPVALMAACALTQWALRVRDPQHIAAVLRSAMVVIALGLPIALIGGAVAFAAPSQAGLVTLTCCGLALLSGLVAREAARPLAPEQSRWLAAIADARASALVPEPQTAIIRTLQALKRASTSPQARPELYLRFPSRLQTVDVAGYLHEQDASAPDELYELALQEPEHTLRAEVLAALCVRRPLVRPLLDWFEVRGAFSATLVCDEDSPIGFLLLPRGDRSRALTLEEARSLRALADRLSALFSVTTALARARQRQYDAEDHAAQREAQAMAVERLLAGQVARNVVQARMLARPLLDNAFSPAARLLLAALEAPPRPTQATLLQRPLGVAATPWAAALHLSRGERRGPLVVIDAALWALDADGLHHPSAILALASSGTLLIDRLELLPLPIQAQLASELGSRTHAAKSAEETPAEIVLGSSHAASQLLEQGLLHPALAQLTEQRTFRLPTLEERPEDLRSIIITTLARSPFRRDGNPLGISRSAMQLLLDYDWPGNDAELELVLGRAAADAAGAQVTYETLAGLATQLNIPTLDTSARPTETEAALDAGLQRHEPHQPRRARTRRRTPRRPR